MTPATPPMNPASPAICATSTAAFVSTVLRRGARSTGAATVLFKDPVETAGRRPVKALAPTDRADCLCARQGRVEAVTVAAVEAIATVEMFSQTAQAL
eukprot:CAMPEP_0177592386 /NCGR_PEP_ID=MMETSP0419_2-20121207/8532_1 /TAXON_ID=582737 /ORGANISM="Tetraselmis sp., Strain GSL018" /LENGTH=97 /DNA_ID=CAMNT_0019083249 /DNA_START=181 /DNA_END=474 /DNA_ORIENTATION=+